MEARGEWGGIQGATATDSGISSVTALDDSIWFLLRAPVIITRMWDIFEYDLSALEEGRKTLKTHGSN